MATTKSRADQFIKAMDKALGEARATLGIESSDIDIRISVKIEDSVTYDLHEDED